MAYVVLGVPPAADRLEGLVTAGSSLLFGFSVLFLFVSSQVQLADSPAAAANGTDAAAGEAAGGADDVMEVIDGEDLTALQAFGLAAAFVALITPLLLTLYDYLALPLLASCAAGGPRAVARATLVYFFFAPIEVHARPRHTQCIAHAVQVHLPSALR